MESLETSYSSRIVALGPVAALAALLLAPAPAVAGPIIDVQGSTLGCFGSPCSDPAGFGSPVSSSSTYGLTFVGSSFDLDTDASGLATNFSLGTIGRGNVNVSSSLPALPFTLLVSFTLPTSITGGQQQSFSATIEGTNTGGGGALDVDFDNTWRTLVYSNLLGSGSFEFRVLNDLDVNKNTLTNPVAIFGDIRNATFTPRSTDPPTKDVPEPASLLLVGTAATALALRRRRQAH